MHKETECVVTCNSLLSAFRYALGRKTYIVSIVVEDILRNWNNLNVNTRELIADEIREARLENRLGMRMDVDQWEKILRKHLEEHSYDV